MARRRSAFRNRVEYVLVRATTAIVGLLPRAAVPAAARFCGRILFWAIKSRRRVVRENVRIAFGDGPSAPDADVLARASLANLCRSFLELFLLPRASRADAFRAMVRTEPPDAVERLRARCGDGGVVFAAYHYGAYEISSAAAPLYGVPSISLVRPLDNPLLERFLASFRMRFGQRLADNRGGLSDLLSELRAGRSAAVLVDLNMPKPGALFPTFFGVPAATAKTAPLLAHRVGRPLVPVFCEREERPFRFVVRFGEPIFPDVDAKDRDADCLRMLQAATNELETRVRARPDQWLWTHRRWKTRPRTDEGRVER